MTREVTADEFAALTQQLYPTESARVIAELRAVKAEQEVEQLRAQLTNPDPDDDA